MEKGLNVIYITFEEAQRLKPFFREAKRRGPWKDSRESASRILQELETIKPISYSPLEGKQIVLNRLDYEFLKDVLDQMEEEGK